MLKNHFVIAVRNIRRHKLYSTITIFCLALGLACCLLIFLFVQDELTHDAFHKQGNDIYRVYVSIRQDNGDYQPVGVTPMPLGPVLPEVLPEVDRVSRLWQWSEIVRRGNQVFKEQLTFVDPAFLEMFSFPLQFGDPAQALREPYSVVVTETLARKYFGDEEVMGKNILVQLGDSTHVFTVTGVASPLPGNSSIQFDILLPYERIRDLFSDRFMAGWGAYRTSTYVQLTRGIRVASVEEKLPTLVQQYMAPQGEDFDSEALLMKLQPLRDIHLNTQIAGLEPTRNPLHSYILSGVALLILLLACINFTTLSVGRAVQRAREVGVRKVVGAHRLQLIRQFIGEAILISLIALILGFVLAELFLPVLNDLAGKQLSWIVAFNPTQFVSVGLFILLVGILAGGYPAFVLSNIRPVIVLKGTMKAGGRSWFGRGLVVLQFVIAIALVACTTIMTRQLSFIQRKDLGFRGDQVVAVSVQNRNGDQVLDIFKQAAGGYPEIRSISGAFELPGSEESFSRTQVKSENVESEAFVFRIDPQYLETLGITLTGGRNFSEQLTTDRTASVLVNETLVQRYGWSDPLGKTLQVSIEGLEHATVIGVVRDFNFQSLHHEIEPAVLHTLSSWPVQHILVKIDPLRISSTLALLKDIWERTAPELPFTYTFLDDQFARLYASEQQWSRIVGYSSGLAILIACLGLFGLATLAATRRTKEIGIRRVLGASVGSIVLLLTKEFTRLILLAALVATPLAYVTMQKWLENFAYRVEIGLGAFLLAGMIAIAIALITVSYQSIRAALIDPAKNLRYE